MVKMVWEPEELKLIEQVKGEIELPKNNIEEVFYKLYKIRPEIYHMKRIIIGLALIDPRQYFFSIERDGKYQRETLNLVDSNSVWSMEITNSFNGHSIKEVLVENLGLDTETAAEVVMRAR